MDYPNAKWRTARRKQMRCANWKKVHLGGAPADTHCIKDITIGSAYWDSGERDDGIWKTWKLCEGCAKAEGK